MSMTMTLLQLTQNVLNEMNSDPVNSISDTWESQQVATLIRDAYFDIIYSSLEWKFTQSLLQLNGASDLSAPTQLIIPTTVVDIIDLKYNVRTLTDTNDMFQNITPIEPEEFLLVVQGRNSSGDNIVQVNSGNGVVLNCYNDRAPTLYTSFDDQNIFFDSYDSTVDDTIQTSKTSAIAIVQQPWYFDDAFIPNGTYNLESLVLNEAKVRGFGLKGERLKRAEDYVKNNTTRAKFTTVKSIRSQQTVQWGRR